MKIVYEYDGEYYIFKVSEEYADKVTDLQRNIVSLFKEKADTIFGVDQTSGTYDIMFQGHPDVENFVKKSDEINDSVQLRIWKDEQKVKNGAFDLQGYQYKSQYIDSSEEEDLAEQKKQ